MPVSRTVANRCVPSCFRVTETMPPGSVYLIALLSRFVHTSFSRSALTRTRSRLGSMSTLRNRSLLCASVFISSTTVSSTSPADTSSICSTRLASSRARVSRRRSPIRSHSSPVRLLILTKMSRTASGEVWLASATSTQVWMVLIGARSSWVTRSINRVRSASILRSRSFTPSSSRLLTRMALLLSTNSRSRSRSLTLIEEVM